MAVLLHLPLCICVIVVAAALTLWNKAFAGTLELVGHAKSDASLILIGSPGKSMATLSLA